MAKIKNVKHSKYKNTALIFNLLTRQITVDLLEDKESVALEIIKKYFNNKTNLNEELLLYNLLDKGDFKSEVKANYYIDSILESRKHINESNLKDEKYNLIKEIKKNYDLGSFFDTKIKNYKFFASIYKLFESTIHKNKNYNPTHIVQSRYVIIENMISPLKNNNITNDNVSEMVKIYKKQDKEIKMLSYNLLIEKFNKKYGVLNINQRRLLKKYIDNLSNTNKLREYVDNEVIKVQKILKKYNEKLSDNKVIKIKLNEISKQANRLKRGKVVRDEQLLMLLKLYELVNKIKRII